MAQVCINITVESIAGIIKSMDAQEVETLCLLLNDEAQELLKRKDEADSGKVKMMLRDEVFDV
jgi:hypothetical protein